jgi:hypothetical protein
VFVSASFAQTAAATAPVPANRGGVFAAATFGPTFAMPAITGQPYSTEQVSQRTQTLIDGTHISHEMPTVRMYRDSAGRTRTERPFMGVKAADGPTIVEIVDPVAGFRYTLDETNRVAHRMAIPPPGSRPRANAAAALSGVPPPPAMAVEPRGVIAMQGGGIGGPMARAGNGMRPEVSSESLGSQVIDGSLAEGRRTTFTYPIGTQGNDRPIVSTSEVWTSRELKVILLSKSSDPRFGETVVKLVNLSRAEPDPSLFQAPADYKIVDEEGPFRVEFNRP